MAWWTAALKKLVAETATEGTKKAALEAIKKAGPDASTKALKLATQKAIEKQGIKEGLKDTAKTALGAGAVSGSPSGGASRGGANKPRPTATGQVHLPSRPEPPQSILTGTKRRSILTEPGPGRYGSDFQNQGSGPSPGLASAGAERAPRRPSGQSAMPPQYPRLDTRRMGTMSGAGGNETLRTRSMVFNPGSEYLEPSYEGRIMRGLKTIGRQIPLIGELVPPTEGATFKQFTLDDIKGNPELMERWDGLSKQEKAFAMFDGTNKSAEMLSSDDDVWARVMGGSSSSIRDGLESVERTGGIGGQRGGLPGKLKDMLSQGQVGGGPGATPAAGAGGEIIPQAQITTNPNPLGMEEDERAPGGRRRMMFAPGVGSSNLGADPRPGELDVDVTRDRRPRQSYVVTTDQVPGYSYGDFISGSDLARAGDVNQGLMRPALADDAEVASYRRLDPDTGAVGGIERFSLARARTDPNIRDNYIPDGGEVEEVISPSSGRRTFASKTAVNADPSKFTRQYGELKPYTDDENEGALVYPTSAELSGARPGRFTPQTTEGAAAGRKIHRYRAVNEEGQAVGPEVRMSEAMYQGNPEHFENLRQIEDEVQVSVDEEGNAVWVSRQDITGGAPGAYSAEAKFKAQPYEDAEQNNAIVYPTESQLRASTGRYTPRAVETVVINKEDVEAMIDFMRKKPQTKDMLGTLNALVSARSMGVAGRAGLKLNEMARTLGFPEVGEDLFRSLSGETDMRPEDLGKLHRYIGSWANQKKLQILNDQRISAVDQDRIDDLVSLGNTFVNEKQMREIIVDFTMYEMLNSELKISARGLAQQFPVGTDEAAVDTSIELEDWGLTEEEAVKWINRMRQYIPQLYPGGQPRLDQNLVEEAP